MLATHLWIPESPVKSPARIDWGGAALLSAALLCLLTGVSYGPQWGWGSTRVLALFVAAAGLAIVWMRFEARAAEPMVDMRVMRERAVWTTNLTGLLVGLRDVRLLHPHPAARADARRGRATASPRRSPRRGCSCCRRRR